MTDSTDSEEAHCPPQLIRVSFGLIVALDTFFPFPVLPQQLSLKVLTPPPVQLLLTSWKPSRIWQATTFLDLVILAGSRRGQERS